jgi:hypothetical protein
MMLMLAVMRFSICHLINDHKMLDHRQLSILHTRINAAGMPHQYRGATTLISDRFHSYYRRVVYALTHQ